MTNLSSAPTTKVTDIGGIHVPSAHLRDGRCIPQGAREMSEVPQRAQAMHAVFWLRGCPAVLPYSYGPLSVMPPNDCESLKLSCGIAVVAARHHGVDMRELAEREDAASDTRGRRRARASSGARIGRRRECQAAEWEAKSVPEHLGNGDALILGASTCGGIRGRRCDKGPCVMWV